MQSPSSDGRMQSNGSNDCRIASYERAADLSTEKLRESLKTRAANGSKRSQSVRPEFRQPRTKLPSYPNGWNAKLLSLSEPRRWQKRCRVAVHLFEFVIL